MDIIFETRILAHTVPEKDRDLRTEIALNYCLDHGLEFAQEHIGSCRELLVCNDVDYYSMEVYLIRNDWAARKAGTTGFETFEDYREAVETGFLSDPCSLTSDGQLCLYAVQFAASSSIEGAIIMLNELPSIEDLYNTINDRQISGGIPFQGNTHGAMDTDVKSAEDTKLLKRMIIPDEDSRSSFMYRDADDNAVHCVTLLRFRFKSDNREFILYRCEDRNGDDCEVSFRKHLEEVLFVNGHYYLSEIEDAYKSERIREVLTDQLEERTEPHPGRRNGKLYDLIC